MEASTDHGPERFHSPIVQINKCLLNTRLIRAQFLGLGLCPQGADGLEQEEIRYVLSKMLTEYIAAFDQLVFLAMWSGRKDHLA